jgi:hypothetical protein
VNTAFQRSKSAGREGCRYKSLANSPENTGLKARRYKEKPLPTFELSASLSEHKRY